VLSAHFCIGVALPIHLLADKELVPKIKIALSSEDISVPPDTIDYSKTCQEVVMNLPKLGLGKCPRR